MKSDIILAGVGGQGILSIAATIGMAALNNKLNLKQSEVHGMSQRGGAVQSHLRISDAPIHSDLIPEGSADLIISVERMEALRYLPFLKKGGWIVTNTTPFVNITNYPELDTIFAELKKQENLIMVDADAIAKEIDSPKSSNMVMLGAAIPFIGIPFEFFEQGIQQIFGSKGEAIVQVNCDALRKGSQVANNR